LQPLDVSCFSVLKQAYEQNVEQIMGCGVNHIDKHEFLPLYRQARQVALYRNNIQAGFAATGLVPYSLDRVLAQLHTEFRISLPQPCLALDTSWVAETPHNVAELYKQTALLKHYLEHRINSPPSPTEQALSQLVKGCEMAILSAMLLVNENEKLRMKNQRQKREGAMNCTYIAKGGILLGAEGASRVQVTPIRVAKRVLEAAVERPQRVLRKCSMCSSIEHTARTCPERQTTS
jgi:hypothetical protein